MVVNLWHNIQHDLRVYWCSWRTQMRAAAMLRGALITQIVGMMLNNCCLVTTWLFFFQHFGTVNGWSGVDYIGVMGVNALVFGVVTCLAAGLADLPHHVDTGSLDSFMTKPTSVLAGVASSNADVTTWGDIVFGLALLVWYGFYSQADPLAILLFLLALITASILFFCFALLLPNIVAFYVFEGDRLSRYFGVLFLDAGFYPTGLLTGPLRTIFLLAIPALLFTAIPLDILRGLHWEWVGGGAVVALAWLVVSLGLFRRALRRYESANLVGAR